MPLIQPSAEWVVPAPGDVGFVSCGDFAPQLICDLPMSEQHGASLRQQRGIVLAAPGQGRAHHLDLGGQFAQF